MNPSFKKYALVLIPICLFVAAFSVRAIPAQAQCASDDISCQESQYYDSSSYNSSQPASAPSSAVPAVNFNAQPGSNGYGAFQIVQCDGPDLSQLKYPTTITVKGQRVTTTPGHNPPNYTPCDFQHLMIEAQFLINAMVILGVLGAIIGFAYAGYLYITGVPGNIDRARKIFPKIAGGFILMLTAWFIVYQILSWLTGNASAFLGSGS